MDDAKAISSFLTEPFPEAQIKQREGAGRKQFDYVPGGLVIDRLIKSTDNCFSWDLITIDYHPERTVTKTTREGGSYQKVYPAFWMAQGKLAIRGLGSRDGVGTQIEESEDSAKGAETDALKRAAVKFGVALNLYIKDDDSPRDWAEEFAARCESMGYTGKKSILCGHMMKKDKVALQDYADCMKLSALVWNAAIDSLQKGSTDDRDK